MSDLVETVALWVMSPSLAEAFGDTKLTVLDGAAKDDALASAQRLLSLIESHGHRIVPVEPTDEMDDAAFSAKSHTPRTLWSAMLAAAPKVTP